MYFFNVLLLCSGGNISVAGKTVSASGQDVPVVLGGSVPVLAEAFSLADRPSSVLGPVGAYFQPPTMCFQRAE